MIATRCGGAEPPVSAKERSPMSEGSVLVHIWSVEPEQEAACIERLDELFAKQITTDAGFVSARILESEDHASVAAVIEMRSPEDRERIEQLPDVRETLDNLHGAANLILRLYQQVKAYDA
jgi:hypothetical protein